MDLTKPERITCRAGDKTAGGGLRSAEILAYLSGGVMDSYGRGLLDSLDLRSGFYNNVNRVCLSIIQIPRLVLVELKWKAKASWLNILLQATSELALTVISETCAVFINPVRIGDFKTMYKGIQERGSCCRDTLGPVGEGTLFRARKSLVNPKDTAVLANGQHD